MFVVVVAGGRAADGAAEEEKRSERKLTALSLALAIPRPPKKPTNHPTGTNFCIRARCLALVGWFPEYTITEDYALSMELKMAGVKVCACVWKRRGR